MAYTSEDIKKMNCITLLQKLYQLKTATMAELMQATMFSQSATRSSLKALEEKQVVSLSAMDTSSGGRCPGRYAFVKERFLILSVFIDEGTVILSLKDIDGHCTLQETISCDFDEHLEEYLYALAQQYPIRAMVIGSSGVIAGDCFYTDQGEMMEQHDLAHRIKQQFPFPILIENDVKAMMMGIQAKKQVASLAYLYMSNTGVGSAYTIHSRIHRGMQGFSGELGLLPYHGKTINEVIATQPPLAVLEELYIQVIVTIATTIDPAWIILSGKPLPNLALSTIKKGVTTCLSNRYQLQIEVSRNPLQDALDGLHYLGIQALFEEYTKEERKSK